MEIKRIIDVKQIVSTVIGGLILTLILSYLDFIKGWFASKGWPILIGIIIGGVIGWKFFEICRFFMQILKKIWKITCCIGRWFKAVFTINKLEAKINELKEMVEKLETNQNVQIEVADSNSFKGKSAQHNKYGKGMVIEHFGSGENSQIEVLFSDGTKRKFVLKYANLKFS